jgi:filamentous hemagglutinin family protein
VHTQGAVTNVTTATVRGANAFNSFSIFNVPHGTTANVHVPASAHNLINIVRDRRSDVHGVLNSIRDGRIGGNVWFANPHGFLVGPTGVVNVGALTLTTPTQAFVDKFFVSPGNPNDAAVSQLLAGTEPRNASGTIAVQGRINAAEGVRLSAGAINVAGSIYSGARFVGTAPDFTDVVNTNGLVAGTNVVVREGRIELVADGDVKVSVPRRGRRSFRQGGRHPHRSGRQRRARGRRQRRCARRRRKFRRRNRGESRRAGCALRSRRDHRCQRRRERRRRLHRAQREA